MKNEKKGEWGHGHSKSKYKKEYGQLLIDIIKIIVIGGGGGGVIIILASLISLFSND